MTKAETGETRFTREAGADEARTFGGMTMRWILLAVVMVVSVVIGVAFGPVAGQVASLFAVIPMMAILEPKLSRK